tara:strand:- start:385 stop:699 length:315 start_codon:yes stop_codon:yes gene_type:complete
VEEHDQQFAQELLALRKRLARRRPPLLQALDAPGLDRWPVDPVGVLALEEPILLGQLLALRPHVEQLLQAARLEAQRVRGRLQRRKAVVRHVEDAVDLRRWGHR